VRQVLRDAQEATVKCTRSSKRPIPPVARPGGTFALYTRLCRSLGIQASGKAIKKEEHEEVMQAAAAVGDLTRRTSIARTRSSR
jgi:hypothetical protein